MAMGAIGQPAARSHLAQTLVRSQVAPQAQPWIKNPNDMIPLLNHLRDSGLALEEHRGFWALTAGAREPVCRRAFRQGRLKPLAVAGQCSYDAGKVVLDGLGRDLAAFRLAFMEGRTEDWLQAQERLSQHHRAALGHRDPLALICGQPFDPDWFEALPSSHQSYGAWPCCTTRPSTANQRQLPGLDGCPQPNKPSPLGPWSNSCSWRAGWTKPGP